MICFFTAGHSPALDYACRELANLYSFSKYYDESITHLLLPIPSFDSTGRLTGGDILSTVLKNLPKHLTVIGGKLDVPELDGFKKMDLLKDPFYLADNAKITAHCAVSEAMNHYPGILAGSRILILGWGRIGKCLAALLGGMGAIVSVFARKPADQAMAGSLGFRPADLQYENLEEYDLIFNTVPAMILPTPPKHPLKIDLASVPGIAGDDVLQALRLPGRFAPQSSGHLIARSVIRILEKEELIP